MKYLLYDFLIKILIFPFFNFLLKSLVNLTKLQKKKLEVLNEKRIN